MTDDEYFQTSSDAGMNNPNLGMQMPQFPWMGNTSHGFGGYGGGGSMFNLAGNNAGFNLGNFNKGYETTETDAKKTLDESEDESGGGGNDGGGEETGGGGPTPGEVMGQGFKEAGNIMANMYGGNSGSIFS